MGGLVDLGNNQVMVNVLSKKAEPFSFLWQKVSGTSTFYISLVHESKKGRRYEKKKTYSANVFLRLDDTELFDLVSSDIDELKETLGRSILQEVSETAGYKPLYPDVRVWAALSLKQLPLIENAYIDIPGWIWPKWNLAHPGMKAEKHGGVVPKNAEVVEIIRDSTQTTESEVGKKFRVVKPDTNRKIRKPRCPQHNNEMTFNAVDQKWHCPEKNCVIKAAPKREAEAGRVTLGMGKVSARYMLVPDEDGKEITPRVVLVSDDNIALDITDYIDMARLEQEWGIEEVIADVKKAGRDSTAMPQKQIPVVMPMNLMGITNIE